MTTNEYSHTFIGEQWTSIVMIQKLYHDEPYICHELSGGYSQWHRIYECPAIHGEEYPGHPAVISHRTVFKWEIVLEMDNPDYDTVKEQMRLLVSTIEAMHIPYWIVWSGNRSYHIHILLDPATISIPDELASLLRNSQVDVPRYVRRFLAYRIIRASGLSPIDFDLNPISFDSVVSKGHMIRMPGQERTTNNFCSVVDTIYDVKPTISTPVIKHNISKWDISHYRNQIINGLERLARKTQHVMREVTAEWSQIPCVQKFITGIPQGKRNSAVYAMAVIGTNIGASKESAMAVADAIVNNYKWKRKTSKRESLLQ